MQDYALHNALCGHIVARVDQLKDGSRLRHSVWVNFPILKSDRRASMANNVYLEMVQQILSDTIGCTNDHLVDKLPIPMQRRQILVQTWDLRLSFGTIYLAGQNAKHTLMQIHDGIVAALIRIDNGICV